MAAFKSRVLTVLGAASQNINFQTEFGSNDHNSVAILNNHASATITVTGLGDPFTIGPKESRQFTGMQGASALVVASNTNPTEVQVLVSSSNTPPSFGNPVTAVPPAGAVTEAMLQAASTINVLGEERTAHGVYDFAVHGGAIADIPFGPTLPTGAIVVAAWLEVETTIAGVGASVAFGLNQAGALADIKAAAVIAGYTAGTIVQGLPVGESDKTKFVDKLTAPAQFVISPSAAVLTAGKVHVHARYVVGF